MGFLTKGFAISFFKERLFDFLSENTVIIYCNKKTSKPVVLILDTNKTERRLSLVNFISIVVSGGSINSDLIGKIKGFRQAIEELDESIHRYLEEEKEDKSKDVVAIEIVSSNEELFVTGFENSKTKEEFVKISEIF